jgi:hypothetical protein
MPCWTSSRNCRALLLAAIMLVIASPSVAQWRVIPEARVSGGDESDLVIDPGVNRLVVPGGAFAELTPRLAARSWIRKDALLDLGTFASFQQFFNDESRLLYAQTLWGELYQNFGPSFRGRLSTALDYFSDSEQREVERLGYGVETGFGFIRPSWNAELWGAAYGRSYPNLTVTNVRGRSSNYREATWSGAGTLRIAPASRVSLRADAIYQTTDALDSFYDSRSWTASASIDGRVVSSLFVTILGTYQRRDFVNRAAAENQDEYAQAGVGLRYSFAPGWMVLARAALAKYTWPDGSEVTSHRFSLGMSYAWGRRDALPPPGINIDTIVRESKGAIQIPDTSGSVVFRIYAPGAGDVRVIGTFNEWMSEATPLRKRADGWWEARVVLTKGTYEYAYLVDGEYVTPPESLISVDDGFGRQNGVIEVLQSNN